MLESAAEQGLAGVIAKRKYGRYEAGKRSGPWAKYRLNSGQELVISGYIPGALCVDSIIVGFYLTKEHAVESVACPTLPRSRFSR